MKPKDIAVVAIVLVLLGAVAWVWLAPGTVNRAPRVAIPLLDGGRIALAQQRTPTLVTFWSTTCSGCIAEMPHLVELHRDLAASGLTIVGIAMNYDDPDQVAEMARVRGLPYAIAWDRDGSLASAFGDVKLTPTSFLIDPDGNIVHQKLGEMDMTRVRSRIRAMQEGAA